MTYKPDKYPEHAKLAAISDESHAIGAFLDGGLHDQGLILAETHRQQFGRRSDSDRLVPANRSIQGILARYFDIDQDALEREKRQMLEEMAEMTGGEARG